MTKPTSYTTGYIQRYLIRSVVRPIINKLLPTWKAKAIALVILYIAYFLYSGGWYMLFR